ncbi:30S ribosomal protein S2 [Candidatus Roizmanbacteria bacterium CG10_big_fil_rev_8_21_14_0_10_45_7]|uniref:Small ribosomal subunit protein uS2 n=1 Tax=Candidatus Roizmanbacteria bacterium CG10_big_fil_rev_8_21_14_0_10_45_7 TaxID=1974854 RepID=A0A2M8KTZ8_9BACT|nr:MAG: 30S ribosomal protein S2 [Candidatus Roizmanbacteria bacterium CG10_big_fil_rev_8_21_14_0_10_45_7]
MKTTIEVEKLFELGGHFGHKRGRTTPKAKTYVYKIQNDVAIIDLFQTKTLADTAVKALFDAGKQNKELLVVATKKNIQNFVKDIAAKEKIHYITEKWVGGFFTNFEEIKKNVDRINTFKADMASGNLNSMIKHERNKLEKEINKLLRVYEGVLTLTRMPDVVLMVDVRKEKNALNESRKIQEAQTLQEKKALFTIGVLDTNANPQEVDYPIMVNDDTPPVLEYVVGALLQGFLEGRKQYIPELTQQEKEAKKLEAKAKKNGKPRSTQKTT